MLLISMPNDSYYDPTQLYLFSSYLCAFFPVNFEEFQGFISISFTSFLSCYLWQYEN